MTVKSLEDELRDKETSADISILNEPFPQNVTDHVRIHKGFYEISSMVNVDYGGILEVEPGAVMIFSEEAGIHSSGLFVAAGQLGGTITFAPIQKEWKGISLSMSNGKNILKFCDISGAVGEQYKSPLNVLHSTIYISSSKIHHNHSMDLGGAIYLLNSVAEIKDSTLSDNSSKSKSSAGAISISRSDVTLVGNRFIRNKTIGSGGAVNASSIIFSQDDIFYKINIIDNLFQSNIAYGRGGGIHISNCISLIQNNRFSMNRSYGEGGGISVDGGMNDIMLNRLICNFSAGHGGGISLGSSSSDVRNNSLILNRSKTEGGGIYNMAGYSYVHDNKMFLNMPDKIAPR